MALRSEYTPYSRQLISHELAELREAEGMEQEFRDYMERKQRPKVTDPFAGQSWRPQPMLMSQQDYNDIVAWGKSIEEEEARKAQMQLSHYLVKPQGQVHRGMRAAVSATAPVGSREARRQAARSAAKPKKKPVKKGKRR